MEFTQQTFIVRLPERMNLPAYRARLIACNAHDVVRLSDYSSSCVQSELPTNWQPSQYSVTNFMFLKSDDSR